MPSKLLESLTTNPTDNNNANTPIRQALIIIEHKIRNLEKRKTKLESYRAIQASGKELSNDQKAAVAKYDEVAQSLEFARDLSKQMVQLATASEKEDKKKARKDAIVRAQAETAKIREVLTLQNIMTSFEDEAIRNDFLNGANGAVKLEESDLEHLSKLFLEIQLNGQAISYDEPFNLRAQRAAEHLSMTIDGRPKAFGTTTYEYLKDVLQKIQDCGYLERDGKPVDDGTIINATPNIEATIDDETNEIVMTEPNDNADTETESNVQGGDVCGEIQSDSIESSGNFDDIQQQPQQHIPQNINVTAPLTTSTGLDLPKFEAPSAAAVPAPAFPQQPQGIVNQQPQLQQISQQQPPPHLLRQPQQQIPIPNTINVQAQIPPSQQNQQQQAQVITTASGVGAQPNTLQQHPGHFPPTTVRAVESLFRQRQYIQQQIRPIAEVIGGGKFFFLQDSELDSPDMLVGVPPQATGVFPPQNLDAQQQPNSIPVNIPAPSPTQIQSQSVIQQQKQQPPAQQQPQNITAATIPTQTFTNQSFPPIVPQPQVQAIYTPAPPVVPQSVGVELQPQTQPQNSSQSQPTQLQQIPVFSTQQLPGIPPQMIPVATHHQQQQQQQSSQLPNQQKQNSAGTGTTALLSSSGVNSISVIDAQQQAAAIAASLQQQQNANLISGGPTSVVVGVNQAQQLPGFATGKFPTTTTAVPQMQSSVAAVSGSGGVVPSAVGLHSTTAAQITVNQLEDNYNALRMMEQKAQKIDIKENRQPQQNSVKDIITSSVVTNEWDNDAKLRRSSNNEHPQHHKTSSHHHSHHHSTSHLHSAPHNDNNSGGGNESNQWSNEMHTNNQQQSTGTSSTTTATSSSVTTNNKTNDWSSTFDSNQTESNHWNNTDAGGGGSGYNGRGNGGGRQSFGGRSRGIRGGGNGTNNGGPPPNGYRGRTNYSSATSASQSQQQSNGGRNSGGGVYFRNNDSYYQNGGYNGSKERSNRYGGDNGNGGSSRGPPNSNSGGPPPRTNQNRSNIGGMGPRGSTGGNRSSAGSGYGTRPPRQQDVNV